MDGDLIDVDGVREMVRYFKIDKPMKIVKDTNKKCISENKIINKNEYIKIENARNDKPNR